MARDNTEKMIDITNATTAQPLRPTNIRIIPPSNRKIPMRFRISYLIRNPINAKN